MTIQKVADVSQQNTRSILVGVFLYSFLFLLILRSIEGFIDEGDWTNQIRYLLDRDPRMINLFGAYGQPGSTILELGSLLRILLGVSYAQAFHFSTIILNSGAIAACAAMSFLLFHHPLAWITTVFILLPDRQYFHATPPTTIVMPLIVLMVLFTWWLLKHRAPQPIQRFVLLGGLIGISAATRLDASILAGSMIIAILWYRFGYLTVLSVIAGAAFSFFLANPYLWFSPIQHLADLVRKFTIHYSGKIMPTEVDHAELIRAIAPATLCFIWTSILLIRHRLSSFMPVPIMIGLSGASLLALTIILSSSIQNVRYLAPFLVTWEVILFVLILESLAPLVRRGQTMATSYDRSISMPLVGVFILLHILFNLVLRPYILESLFIGNRNI